MTHTIDLSKEGQYSHFALEQTASEKSMAIGHVAGHFHATCLGALFFLIRSAYNYLGLLVSFISLGFANHPVFKYYLCTTVSSDSRRSTEYVRHSIFHDILSYFLCVSFLSLC